MSRKLSVRATPGSNRASLSPIARTEVGDVIEFVSPDLTDHALRGSHRSAGLIRWPPLLDLEGDGRVARIAVCHRTSCFTLKG